MDAHSIEQFLIQLESVPWFRSLGEPTSSDSDIERLQRWEDWPGPEEPSVLELSTEHQALFDDLMATAGKHQEDLSSLWQRIHAIVFRVARSAVPYDPSKDAWHAPSSAVWQAAWTAGLIGLCLHTGHAIPQRLDEQWKWFIRGHWPAGYANSDSEEGPGRLLVF